MSEETRTPVAIRITRPYASGDEFLEHELDSLTRTTVVLVGAQSRPQGVVLRFEITLATGDPLLRGEGRVVGFRPAGKGAESGLTLRFTRLDARSKALVDRAAALRDIRSGKVPASMPELPPETPSQTAAASRRPVPPPPPLASEPPSLQFRPSPLSPRSADAPTGEATPYSSAGLPAARRTGHRVSAGPPDPAPAATRAGPPAQREELLDRLRQRAKTLTPSAVAGILEQKRRARPA